jgi:translation initiation factor 3 subunit L
MYHIWNHILFARTYSDDGLPAFEELFLYACPKFISANPPPYDDQEQLAAYAEDPPPEPAQHHLALFLADVRAQAAVPTLRSFLKLYTSLDAAKLAGFLDADEEEMVQQMMAVKAASRSVSRVGNEQNLLDGQMISTSDMDFVINEVRPNSFFARLFDVVTNPCIHFVSDQNMVHISEVTVGRRFAGWFIRNTEHAQRVLDGVKNSPLPLAPQTAAPEAESKPAPPQQKKVAWGISKA